MAAQEERAAVTKSMRVLSCVADLTDKDMELCDDLLQHIPHLIKDRNPSSQQEQLRETLWRKVFERWNTTNVGTMRPVLLDPQKGLLAHMPYYDLPLGYLMTDTDTPRRERATRDNQKRHGEVKLRVTVKSDTAIAFDWIDADGHLVENHRVKLTDKYKTLQQAQAVACKHYDRVHAQKASDHNTYLAIWMARHRLAFSLLEEFETKGGEHRMSDWDKFFYTKAREVEFLEFQEQPRLCKDVLENMADLDVLYGDPKPGYDVGDVVSELRREMRMP